MAFFILMIRDKLVALSQSKLDADPQPVWFTSNVDANNLLNDLHNYPHAFVIGCVMDRQMKSARSWLIPYEFSLRVGHFDFPRLALLSEEEVNHHMLYPHSLHRFKYMGTLFYSAIQKIASVYDGNAAVMWNDIPSSAVLVNRFREFNGVGQKIATMAANILVRDFRVPVSDKYSIDISIDSHVIRVFSRLLLGTDSADKDWLIYKARELHPQYPGIFDFALWELGSTVCRPARPNCAQCYMVDLCKFANP